MALVVGVTGGIGSGKSAVTTRFEDLGITIKWPEWVMEKQKLQVILALKNRLLTILSDKHREAKYKSKNFIDTVVYRGSDVTASWIFKGMLSAGLSLSQIAWIYLPVLGLWGFGAWRLGKIYARMREGLRPGGSVDP